MYSAGCLEPEYHPSHFFWVRIIFGHYIGYLDGRIL